MNKDLEIKEVLEYEKFWINLILPRLLALQNKLSKFNANKIMEHKCKPNICQEDYMEQIIGARLAMNF